MLRHDILVRYILSRRQFRAVRQVTIGLKLASSTAARTLRPRWTKYFPCLPPPAPGIGAANGSGDHRAPNLGSGVGCDAGAKPSGYSRHARHHRCVRESARRRTDPELSGRVLPHHSGLPAVAADAARSLPGNGAFGQAVSATNYAVEGVAQNISEKALRGLAKNEKIGPRGRWWLEEHAKYDDEHPIQALEIIKSCVTRGETPTSVTDSARKSLALMKDAMVACYDS